MPTFPDVKDTTPGSGRVAVLVACCPVSDYKIVTAATAAALATAVKAEFSGGWIPYGNAQEFSATVFLQTMVKY